MKNTIMFCVDKAILRGWCSF